tara:strand:+ start:1020 stop:1298 length:279 start_codon:yes stop_codon:yes gene_type:complete
MSKKIDESFLTNFARNMAVYVAAKAVSSNSDKIKNALGLSGSDTESDAAIRDLEKAQKKLAKSFEKRLKNMDPERREKILKKSSAMAKRLGL